MQNILYFLPTSPKVSPHYSVHWSLASHLNQVQVQLRPLGCSFLRITLWVQFLFPCETKVTKYLSLHKSNIQWWDSNRVTAIDIPVQQEVKWKAQRSRWSIEILKHSWAKDDSSLIKSQGLGIILPSSQHHVLGAWFRFSHLTSLFHER